MFTFRFQYTDNTYQDYQNITKVEYYNAVGSVTVPENEILQHNFPVSRDMYLFAANAKYSASSKNLKSISVYKEE